MRPTDATGGNRPVDRPRSRWAGACAVLAVTVTMILAARQLRPPVATAAFLARTGEVVTPVPLAAWPRAALWIAISIAVVARWRTVAALGAWVAVAYEVLIATRFPGDEAPFWLAWQPLLALTAAVLLSVPAPPGAGLRLLGRRGRWLLAAAATVTAATAAAIPLLGEYYGHPPEDIADPGFFVVFAVSSRLAGAIAGLTFVAVFAFALAALWHVDRAVRDRALTLAAAGTVGFVAMQLGMPLPFGVLSAPLLSGAAQIALPVAAPVIVLCAGLIVLRLREPRRPAKPLAS